MGLVFQMINAGNGLTANSASTSSINTPLATADGTGSVLPFAQALIQKISGTTGTNQTAPATVSTDPLVLLQGLLKEMQISGSGTQEETDSNTANLLNELAQDIEKLDEAIGNDPLLLEALQGWLLQVAALVPGEVNQDGQTETDAAVLSPLAQNPETLRFAVQDDLNRLVSLIQEAAAGGNEELTAKRLAVLNRFTELMAQSAVSADKTAVVKENSLSTGTPVVKSEASIQTPVTVAADSGKSDSGLSDTLQTRVVTNDLSKTGSKDEPFAEFNLSNADHEIVTAGQLSLRNGITAPLKAETPQVPVQNFANEMTGLVTGKLEVVQKGGVAEATITLFPDNLGQVDVKISMQNGHIVAQFVTENAGAKDLLEQQMAQLRTALQSQGLQVEKLEVTQNNTPLQSQMQQEGRQAGAGSQQSKQQPKNRNEAIVDSAAAAELNGEWQDWLVNGKPEDRDQTGSFSAKA
jgi:flagellar hook-length control protein FliK